MPADRARYQWSDTMGIGLVVIVAVLGVGLLGIWAFQPPNWHYLSLLVVKIIGLIAHVLTR